MGSSRRQTALTESIQSALFRDSESFKKTVIGRICAFFSIFYIRLLRYKDDIWKAMRNEAWEIDEEEYKDSFQSHGRTQPLKPMGDLGYSGSTFFSTSNCSFLVKSLPRHFEHSFFRDDLLQPYCQYMSSHLDSLLVWITDYVYAPYKTIGALLSITPAHHIIMENMLCGKEDDPAGEQWETYDLKPIDYFYPERDLVPDPLVSEETLRKVYHAFDDKIRIRRRDYEDLKEILKKDTSFLEAANTVDYSLLVVRFPASSSPDVIGRKNRWRLGLPSVDGRWKYRLVLLDFFWARHKFHAQAMTGMVQTFNVISYHGPMTITTTAEEYRQKFLAMIDGMMEVYDS